LVIETIKVLKLADAVLKRNLFRIQAYQLGNDMVKTMESEIALSGN
jgi:hypothetical protein